MLEEDKQLHFLDIILSTKGDVKLGYWVYIKKTHKNRYFHANSHHHQEGNLETQEQKTHTKVDRCRNSIIILHQRDHS